MKGDFTRVSYDRFRHFSRVLQQQGRVTLDADWNEQSDILLHYLRTLAKDLLGPHARPTNQFELQYTGSALMIEAGHYYIDGILVENDASCDYAHQWDYTPDPNSDKLLQALAVAQSAQSGTFGLYLDVWERHISWLEDDYIREKALGGPDTCSRAKVVWQVKAAPLAAGTTDCDVMLPGNLKPPLLNARLDPGAAPKDPCTLSPDARYRGAENQLYRIEVHASSEASTPTFKWSRDNGSVATSWLNTESNDLVVHSTRGFAAGNIVELLDDDTELRGKPGVLVALSKVENGRLTVDPASILGGILPAWNPQLRHPRVRRWDQVDNDATELSGDNAVPIVESTIAAPRWITLEDGVQIQFIENHGTYKTGDYWLIPARVATGDIEWPPGGSDPNGPWADSSREPAGIEHHYAPLGIVVLTGNNEATVTMCPCIFEPISDCSEQSRKVTDNQITPRSYVPVIPPAGSATPALPAPSPRPTRRRSPPRNPG